MSAIDHMSLGVTDIPAAREFYSPLLSKLGINCLTEGEGFAVFGRARVEFLPLARLDGRAASAGDGAHVAFSAPDRDAVTKAYAAGLDAGASDEGAPGVRAAYPIPDVVAAYLRDPWGNKIEVIHGGLSA